jgi:hypothetical protein
MNETERVIKMSIIVLNLGITSLIALLILFIGMPLFITMPTLAIGSSVSIMGLILGIVALVIPKLNKRIAVIGLVTCSLGVVVSAVFWIV